MSYNQQIALWAIAVITPFCLNCMVGRRPDAMGLSGMLIVGWGFQRVCGVIWTPPEAMQFYPILDALFGMTAFYAWLTAKRAWKLSLACVFVAQCALHAAFWAGWEQNVGQPTAATSLLRYIELNNIAFAVELCLVSWPGVSDVAHNLVRGVPPRAWLRDHAGP